MKPTLLKGGLVIIDERITPKINDIVVFTIPNENYQVIHRIIGETTEGFITKGDNSVLTDQQNTELNFPVIPRKYISGVLIIYVQHIGGLIIAFNGLLVILMFIYLIVYLDFKYFRKKRVGCFGIGGKI